MRNVYDVLKERGLIAQVTHEEEVRNLLENEKVTFNCRQPSCRSLFADGSYEAHADARSSPHSSCWWRYRSYR